MTSFPVGSTAGVCALTPKTCIPRIAPAAGTERPSAEARFIRSRRETLLSATARTNWSMLSRSIVAIDSVSSGDIRPALETRGQLCHAGRALLNGAGMEHGFREIVNSEKLRTEMRGRIPGYQRGARRT